MLNDLSNITTERIAVLFDTKYHDKIVSLMLAYQNTFNENVVKLLYEKYIKQDLKLGFIQEKEIKWKILAEYLNIEQTERKEMM